MNITKCTGLFKTKTLKQWPKTRTVQFGVIDPDRFSDNVTLTFMTHLHML